MATNRANAKQAQKRSGKPNTGTGSSKAKSKAALKASAQKENIQPQHDPQSNSSADDPTILASVLQQLEEMKDLLRKETEEKRKLEQTIEALRVPREDEEMLEDSALIPRPVGTAGQHWSLQIAMGLAGSQKKNAKYAALLRGMRDLVLQSGMKWEFGWKEIAAAEKSKVFRVARERYPILKRYSNDWATAEMIKQYIKNKRAHHYRSGWLEVPEKYAYLKQNSSKRSTAGSRVKRVTVDMAAKQRAKQVVRLEVRSRKETRKGAKNGRDDIQNELPNEEPGHPSYGKRIPADDGSWSESSEEEGQGDEEEGQGDEEEGQGDEEEGQDDEEEDPRDEDGRRWKESPNEEESDEGEDLYE